VIIGSSGGICLLVPSASEYPAVALDISHFADGLDGSRRGLLSQVAVVRNLRKRNVSRLRDSLRWKYSPEQRMPVGISAAFEDQYKARLDNCRTPIIAQKYALCARPSPDNGGFDSFWTAQITAP
jgi:hypothetical protein